MRVDAPGSQQRLCPVERRGPRAARHFGIDGSKQGIVYTRTGCPFFADAGLEAQVVARGRRGLVQPAVKCRGRDYLRIIYGPDYDAPEHLDRLRKRGLGQKRAMALSEFSLGLEALRRFVRRAPLAQVHQCVFGVLALESEPVDPRL